MTKRTFTLGTGLVASLFAALALATWTTASAAPSKLKGTVGPGDTIALKTAAGKKVSVVSRGTSVFVSATPLDDSCAAASPSARRATQRARSADGRASPPGRGSVES